MVKEKIENPWQCRYCMKKFTKDKDDKWKKLEKLQFDKGTHRHCIIKQKDNPNHYIYKSKWVEHLYFRLNQSDIPQNQMKYKSGTDPMTAVCPKSLCLFCLVYDKKLINFENNGQYNYHRKKCKHRAESIKQFISNNDSYLEEQNLLEELKTEQEEKEEKDELEQELYEQKKKQEEEEKLRKEEDFKSRASFYDPPQPRSQESIDREKKYKKCPKEKAIEISMAEN
tara:strand:+ start:49 stop:726 length:678 start_codon:yes stop_codon:yes gene_type:complete